MRAECRLGELIRGQKETIGLNQGAVAGKTGSKGVPVFDAMPTLADSGIDKKLSSVANDANSRQVELVAWSRYFGNGAVKMNHRPSWFFYTNCATLFTCFLVIAAPSPAVSSSTQNARQERAEAMKRAKKFCIQKFGQSTFVYQLRKLTKEWDVTCKGTYQAGQHFRISR